MGSQNVASFHSSRQISTTKTFLGLISNDSTSKNLWRLNKRAVRVYPRLLYRLTFMRNPFCFSSFPSLQVQGTSSLPPTPSYLFTQFHFFYSAHHLLGEFTKIKVPHSMARRFLWRTSPKKKSTKRKQLSDKTRNDL